LYDRLFTKEIPDEVGEGEDYSTYVNPKSLEILTDCRLEPGLAEANPGDKFQFERTGYFCVDPDSIPGKPVFNRTVTLKDTWAKIEQKADLRGLKDLGGLRLLYNGHRQDLERLLKAISGGAL
ncbi:MAG: hypothetical protein C0393_02445, partial [Anaerolinea sp.]|nr:hypothetical protein [Anaerolinea sp.]